MAAFKVGDRVLCMWEPDGGAITKPDHFWCIGTVVDIGSYVPDWPDEVYHVEIEYCPMAQPEATWPEPEEFTAEQMQHYPG